MKNIHIKNISTLIVSHSLVTQSQNNYKDWLNDGTQKTVKQLALMSKVQKQLQLLKEKLSKEFLKHGQHKIRIHKKSDEMMSSLSTVLVGREIDLDMTILCILSVLSNYNSTLPQIKASFSSSNLNELREAINMCYLDYSKSRHNIMDWHEHTLLAKEIFKG